MALRFKLTTMSSNGLLVWYELKEGWDIKSFLAIVLVDGKVSSNIINLELLQILIVLIVVKSTISDYRYSSF